MHTHTQMITDAEVCSDCRSRPLDGIYGVLSGTEAAALAKIRSKHADKPTNETNI